MGRRGDKKKSLLTFVNTNLTISYYEMLILIIEKRKNIYSYYMGIPEKIKENRNQRLLRLLTRPRSYEMSFILVVKN